ncbi:MAG: hypothetical protein IJ371_06375 [Clostridia bacterium]|nr:hypothetical protein [Clostridia bacterium]
MNFTKEQIDFVKHCGEHFEVLTGGRGHSKTNQIIERLQQENARLKDKINESIEYIRDCCNMDSKWVNLHYDYAQKEMSSDEVDRLLEILKEN